MALDAFVKGVEVSHPAPGSMKTSISAFVFTRYHCSCSDYSALSAIQKSRSETITDFGAMFKARFLFKIVSHIYTQIIHFVLFTLRRFDSTTRAELQEMGQSPDPSRKYIPSALSYIVMACLSHRFRLVCLLAPPSRALYEIKSEGFQCTPP